MGNRACLGGQQVGAVGVSQEELSEALSPEEQDELRERMPSGMIAPAATPRTPGPTQETAD